jgi:hypothetical protein
MEKFYRVTDASHIKAMFLEAEENKRIFFERLNAFSKQHGLENAGTLGKGLYLKDTQDNEDKFGRQLSTKATKDGYRKFKANSPIAKQWGNCIMDIESKPHDIPWAFAFRHIVGRHGYLAFEHKGEVYLRFAAYETDFEDPEGFEEIKGSEFNLVREAENALRDARRASCS